MTSMLTTPPKFWPLSATGDVSSQKRSGTTYVKAIPNKMTVWQIRRNTLSNTLAV